MKYLFLLFPFTCLSQDTTSIEVIWSSWVEIDEKKNIITNWSHPTYEQALTEFCFTEESESCDLLRKMWYFKIKSIHYPFSPLPIKQFINNERI